MLRMAFISIDPHLRCTALAVLPGGMSATWPCCGSGKEEVRHLQKGQQAERSIPHNQAPVAVAVLQHPNQQRPIVHSAPHLHEAIRCMRGRLQWQAGNTGAYAPHSEAYRACCLCAMFSTSMQSSVSISGCINML